MNKFAKRLTKLSRKNSNAIVIGSAFGQLSEIIKVYNTVFLINDDQNDLRAKNLVYRESIDRMSNIDNVGAIFFDLSTLSKLENLQIIWQKNKSTIFVEGGEIIGRELSKPLYSSGWRCTSLQGIFHVWEQLQ